MVPLATSAVRSWKDVREKKEKCGERWQEREKEREREREKEPQRKRSDRRGQGGNEGRDTVSHWRVLTPAI